jgi:hypothetical protein
MSSISSFCYCLLPTQDGTTGLGGGQLPLAMDLDNPQIVTALRSGVLLCDLINAVRQILLTLVSSTLPLSLA